MEKGEEGAGPGAPRGVEKRAGTQKRRGVHIVPAGVHLSISGGIGHAGGFLDRQPIEVCAQQSSGPMAVAEDSDHTKAADVFYYFAFKIGELGADASGGALLFMRKLGVAVQVFVKALLPPQIGFLGSDKLGDAGRIRHGFTP